MAIGSAEVQRLAHACGFEIAGVTPAEPHADFARFENWCQTGKAAELTYLTDRRGGLRADPRLLLPSARSIICLGKLYNTDRPLSTECVDPERGWISRYAWGRDYHDVLRPPLEDLVSRMTEVHGMPFDAKICIDTAPLLERSYARAAGLGWIGKNTCLINQHHGSWFFLAELLVSIPLEGGDAEPDRCGSCTRCIQACPTNAIVPNAEGGFDPKGGFNIDARLCLSYLTIEKRGTIAPELAALNGRQLFGCDICQDVCPWNQRARQKHSSLSSEESFAARIFAPDLVSLAALEEHEFRTQFRQTAIWRTRYAGFLRNVAIAMGNSGREEMRAPLAKLARHQEAVVAEAARHALFRLDYLIKLG